MAPAQPKHQAGALVVLELEQVQEAVLAASQTDPERRDREDCRDAFEGAHRSSGDGAAMPFKAFTGPPGRRSVCCVVRWGWSRVCLPAR